jgi:hypothetical protein
MLQRLALYSALGLVLDALDQSIATAGFWCIVALFIASEWMTRREVWEDIEQQVEQLRAQTQQRESEEANNGNNDQPK